MTIRIAVLDDYQDIARRFGDWHRLPDGVELTVFTDHVDDPEALVARLAPFTVVCAMRERSPFPRAVLERLPELRL
ncbi:hydroxyacid dehydrogenase, partial [Marinitenerispora sediminis]